MVGSESGWTGSEAAASEADGCSGSAASSVTACEPAASAEAAATHAHPHTHTLKTAFRCAPRRWKGSDFVVFQ